MLRGKHDAPLLGARSTLAAAPPKPLPARARTSTNTSVPSRSRRIRSISPPRALRPARDPIIALHQRQAVRAAGAPGRAPRRRRPAALVAAATAPRSHVDRVPRAYAGRRRSGRRAAVSRRRAVRGGHADRQPGRPDAARGARARRWSTRWPARTRASAPACCATWAWTSRCSRCTSTTKREAAQRCCERLARGERVAYVSDAGTPAVSDPGAALVAAVRAAGLPRACRSPAPAASLAALSVAGDARRPAFVFAGFLPAKGARERRALRSGAARATADAGAVRGAAPHRGAGRRRWREPAPPRPRHPVPRADQTVRDRGHAGRRPSCPAGWPPTPTARAASSCWCCTRCPRRTRPTATRCREAEPSAALALLLAELPLKQAVALAAALSGAPRNALYAARAGAAAAATTERRPLTGALEATASRSEGATLLQWTRMISREPTIERLAIAQAPAARALRADEARCRRRWHHRRAPHRRRRPVLPEHAPRRLEPGRRHRQERQLQHRPGRGRARRGRREDRVCLLRRHLRSRAARCRAHGAHASPRPARAARQGRRGAATRGRQPRAVCADRPDRHARQHAEGGAAGEASRSWRAPRTRAWCR